MKTLQIAVLLLVAAVSAWLLVPPPADVQISQIKDQLQRIDEQLEHIKTHSGTRERLRQERQLLAARMGSLCWELADGDCSGQF